MNILEFTKRFKDEEPLKKGRDSKPKAKVLVMTDSEPAEDSKYFFVKRFISTLKCNSIRKNYE